MVKEKSPFDLIQDALCRCLGHPKCMQPLADAFDRHVPDVQRSNVEAVLASAPISYRDGLLIQLAYGICSPTPLDLTKRPPGARGTAAKLGSLLARSHVQCVADAYQNIAKNSAELARGNVACFDGFLRWASEKGRTAVQLVAAFEYVCARVAATARPVLPMPPLNLSSLTFAGMSSLIREMLSVPSDGAHEQFIIAALLHALVEQSAVAGYRVETKKLNASDASSRVAGDIQILAGSRVIEAYEVTANEWASKLDKAGKTIRDHDLSRLHIVARVDSVEHQDMLARIGDLRDDVSVVEIRSFAEAIASALTRRGRAVALERLYQFLDRYQGVVERVNEYVRRLHARGLAAEGEPRA